MLRSAWLLLRLGTDVIRASRSFGFIPLSAGCTSHSSRAAFWAAIFVFSDSQAMVNSAAWLMSYLAAASVLAVTSSAAVPPACPWRDGLCGMLKAAGRFPISIALSYFSFLISLDSRGGSRAAQVLKAAWVALAINMPEMGVFAAGIFE